MNISKNRITQSDNYILMFIPSDQNIKLQIDETSMSQNRLTQSDYYNLMFIPSDQNIKLDTDENLYKNRR